MSASTEKKQRQAAREAGTDKKMLAAQEEAKKKAQSRRRWTIGSILVALLIVAIILLNTNLPYTATTALTIGDERYSPAQVNYYYANDYHNYLNTSEGYYAAMLGMLDTSTGISGLGSQSCLLLEDGTWKDYFLEAAEADMLRVKALKDYANANGITLDAEELAAVDANFDGLKDYVKSQGYNTVNQFFAAYYGKGVTQKLTRQEMLNYSLAGKAYTQVSDSKEYTDAELEDYYQSLAGESDLFDYAYYYVAAATVDVESTDENGETVTTQESTELTRAEARATADAIAAGYKDGDEEDYALRLNAAVDHEIDGEEANVRTAVDGSELSAAFKDWLMSASRKAGDISVLENSTGDGWYVVVFLGRDDNHYATANVRHILITAEADENGEYTEEALAAAQARAEEILAQWKAGEATEESFAALAEEHSEDSGSSADGGLYENVYKGQMVEEFEAFCFGDRKSGDTAIVYGNNGSYAGYHVMYYVGEGELYSNVIARSGLLNADMEQWLNDLIANYTVTHASGYRMVG